MNYKEQYEKLFRALGDRHRLTILEQLMQREMNAGELLETVDIVQSTLSHHMKTLCECGLVIPRKQGKWTCYTIDAGVLEDAKDFLGAFAETALHSPAVREKAVRKKSAGEKTAREKAVREKTAPVKKPAEETVLPEMEAPEIEMQEIEAQEIETREIEEPVIEAQEIDYSIPVKQPQDLQTERKSLQVDSAGASGKAPSKEKTKEKNKGKNREKSKDKGKDRSKDKKAEKKSGKNKSKRK